MNQHRGLLAWADEAPRVGLAIVAPAIRLAERAGFSDREVAVYKSEPILLLRRTSGG